MRGSNNHNKYNLPNLQLKGKYFSYEICQILEKYFVVYCFSPHSRLDPACLIFLYLCSEKQLLNNSAWTLVKKFYKNGRTYFNACGHRSA